jgi:hypothetical protein
MRNVSLKLALLRETIIKEIKRGDITEKTIINLV